MNQPALHFSRVAKRYAKRPVLQGIDLDVHAGETFGIVGINGAGKTSLLKCLLDFIRVDEGEIAIDGLPHRDPRARAPLAFLPERLTPPYHLTGDDFLRYSMRLHRHRYDASQASQVLRLLGLDEGALRQPVHACSKGMAQQLGLAACLLARKRILVLDEPAAGLDPRARALLKARIQALHDEGCTVFLTSHVLSDIEDTCERMAVLHDGRLRFTGSPADCRARYGGASLEQAFLAAIG